MSRISIGLNSAVVLICFASEAAAQRVQFPSPVTTSSGIGVAPSYSGVTPYNVAQPTYGTVSPPPAWDPYGTSGASGLSPVGPPPTSTPYLTPQPTLPPVYPPQTSPGYGAPGYGQPGYGSPVYPSQPGAVYPNGTPFGWQQGTYSYQGADGTTARFQRLLQNVGFEYTWLAKLTNDPEELGINRIEAWTTFGFPIFYNTETPLLVTPGAAINFLDGPVSTLPVPSADLPPRLYEFYLDGAWQPQVNEWFGADLGVRVGHYSDLERMNSQSVRYMGRGLGVLSFSPTIKIAGGVWYIDRNRIKLLPAGGVIWTPNPDTNFRILFPNPKLSHRFATVGTAEWWWYFTGEYGGGAYTIERTPAANGAGVSLDRIDYNDLRVAFGLEWISCRGMRGHVEIGFVWDRQIIYYDSRLPSSFKPNDTIMVRAGIDY